MTPDEVQACVAEYCPEDYQVWVDLTYDNQFKPRWAVIIEQKAQARKEREQLKQALEKIVGEDVSGFDMENTAADALEKLSKGSEPAACPSNAPS